MAETTSTSRQEELIRDRCAPLVGLMILAAIAFALRDLAARLPPDQWTKALFAPDLASTAQMLVHFTVYPRIVVAFLGGAALGLTGVVCQQVLRNPLAEPTTLGVAAGASLALSAATLWAPGLLVFGREPVALTGSAVAMFFVIALSWHRALAPASLILAGLIVSLYCGAVAAAIALFNHDYLVGLYIWGAGFLSQQDWSIAAFILPRFLIGFVLIATMIRPLTLLGFDDETARNLGLGLTWTKVAALCVAVGLSASVVSALGVLGFIGLAAPALVTLAGARRFRDRLFWAPLCGGALLWLTDGIVLLIPTGYREIPTGAATALLGAPIMLVLLPRLRAGMLPRPASPESGPHVRHTARWLVIATIALAALVWIALALSQGPYGWVWDNGATLARMLPWRWPRTMAAFGAGAMLGTAGVLMQRMTGNPMAAPEVLGVSSGAALGVIVALFAFADPSRPVQMLAGVTGATMVLGGILLLGRQAAFSPDRLLLAGVATGAVFGAIVSVAMATGNPRMGLLLTWLAGSTYQVAPVEALLMCTTAILLLAIAPLLARWLDILPLGDEVSRSVGVAIGWSRLAIVLVTALMTTAATLIVGPLSFVGLMAPHMARLIGLQRAISHLFGAAIVGASILVVSDWSGRNVIFPYQVPCGLVATLLGGPYLMWLLRKRR